MKKRNSRQYANLPVALACLVALAGCSSAEHQDLRDFIAREKARPPGRIEPLPEFEMYETFAYEARDERDPFRPEEEAILTQGPKVSSGPRPEENRNKEALENFPLDSLTFMGLLQKEGVTWGIVKDPDGMVHRTQVGNHMGQNYGRITAINESKIELIEIVPDGRGGWFEREAAVAISD